MKLSTLKKQAQQSTAWRGHRMQWDSPVANGTRQIAYCRDCSAYVQIDTHPAHNGIDIGGDAVALNCPVTKET